MGSNLLLQGDSGTGKTASLKKVLSTKNGYHIFVSGSTTETAEKTIRALINTTSKGTERLLSEIISFLHTNPKIIIIDEVNRIKNMKYLFDLLNTIYRETGMPIIVASNRKRILSDIELDARKTLLFERLEFKSYNAHELKAILDQRISKIRESLNVKIPSASISFICAKATSDGSARKAIGIASRCLINNDFSEENINRINNKMEEEEWTEFYNDLTQTDKKFLKVCLELYASGKEICHTNLMPHLNISPQRISQLITKFVKDYGVFRSYYLNKGGVNFGGRRRVVDFSTQEVFSKLDGVAE